MTGELDGVATMDRSLRGLGRKNNLIQKDGASPQRSLHPRNDKSREERQNQQMTVADEQGEILQQLSEHLDAA